MMKNTLLIFFLFVGLFISTSAASNEIVQYARWLDTSGNPINAHGGGIMYHDGRYYWYGEYKNGPTYLPKGSCDSYRTDVIGVSCYSSPNMVDWIFEGIVLNAVSCDSSHDLHPSKVLERPKVIHNARTGKYVMWFHVDSEDYSMAAAGVAVSDSPTGPFKYLGAFRPNNAMSRDQTLFVDEDGRAYQFASSEDNRTLYINELTDDYLRPTGRYTRNFIDKLREAPAVFRHGSKYYMLTSGCTGWNPNEAELAMADSIMGPWKTIGNPCTGPEADKTFYAQSTYVQPVYGKKDLYIAMFDRWNKTDLSDSRYVWLPISFDKGKVTIPWREKWNIDEYEQGDIESFSTDSLIEPGEQAYPYKNASLPINERVEDLLPRMTLDEKIAQIRHLHSWDIFDGQVLDEKKLSAYTGNIGWGFVEGFPLTGENCSKNMRAVQKYMTERTRLGIPVFTVAESLHGSAHEGSTIYPQNIALGSTFNPELAYQKAARTSRDLHAQGMRQVLAPCIDVVRDLRWGRVEESYGEDPFLCGIFARAETAGYLDNGISPMLKHFGPHGNPLGGLNLASVECGIRDLHDVYMKPFEMVVTQLPVMAVMSTYNSWNRIPNSASRYLLTDILREQWGFKGYVYSDWGAIDMLQTFHHTAGSPAECAVQSISAGLDVEASSECYPYLKELVEKGLMDISVIDESVRRVLTAKFAAGLFEDPYGETFGIHEMHDAESIALSRKIADESTVLLKNENGLLPLNIDRIRSIAVIGPNAAQVQFGDYSWSRDNKDGVTPLEGIKRLVGDKATIRYARGCSMMSNDTSAISEAVEIASQCDVALLFCGSSSASLARDYNQVNCGEGFDLHDLRLTGAQSDLIRAIHKTGKPVVLVLVSGKPFCLSWEKEHIPAILAQWYAGEQAGNSIADILFGKVNPSGKLTFSFPQSAGHLPAYYNHLPSDKGFYKKPGSYEAPGRDYVFSSPSSLWMFGHGLSYTTFSLEKMTASLEHDSIRVKTLLKNTGNKTGKEVVQLYVRDQVSSVVTPIKQLRAFKKVELQPGESREVVLNFPVADLAITSEDGRRLIEPGAFELQLGTASDRILLKQTIYIGANGQPAGADGQPITVTDNLPTDTKAATAGEEITVSGTVRDVQATLINDVSIISKTSGRKLGQTDSKGKYKVRVSANDILIFEKKRYLKMEVPVNNHTSLNVKMTYGENDM